ncbi:MAG TPA: hypothetical protein VFE62_01600 [Gemmataceae bacterium]|nr:hypothetical protein [Gemmataceae bacterium]
MQANIVNEKIVVTGETDTERELLNYMGAGKLKATIERVIDELTADGIPLRSHDELTIEFDGQAPTPA